jgi:hypothetical protein
MTIIGWSEVTEVNEELNEVPAGQEPCGTFAGTLNGPLILPNEEYSALDLDTPNRGGGRN